MILKKLYIEPSNIFEPVTFRNGLNFIYGIRDNIFEPNDSLNAIGKSIFLDFLDFILLSHFNVSRNNRLARSYNAGLLKNQYVVLEFEIDKKAYSLSRFFDDPYYAFFSGGKYPRKKYKLPELQEHLFKLIFERNNYQGNFNPVWFRDLVKFFLKIQKVSDEKFLNPIRFTNLKEIILNQYHLFLLNIDNTIAIENYSLLKQIDSYKKTVDTSRQLLLENYKLRDMAAVQSKITGLDNQVKKINDAINNFRLSSLHNDLQQRASELTAEIKSLGFLNSSDRNKIKEYEASIKASRFNTGQVQAVYDEIDSELSRFIKNKIEDALVFREQLSDSRKDFVEKEIKTLKWRVVLRDKEISKKQDEVSEILSDLSKKDAISDLTSAYARLSKLVNDKAALSSRFELFKEAKSKINHLQNSNALLDSKIKGLIEVNENKIQQFSRLVSEIYLNVFGVNPSGIPFTVNTQESDQKMKLSVLPDDVYSHGKNQGRTLVYDLAVLFNMIAHNIKGPRFLVHDRIFDSLDKTHLRILYNYLSGKENEAEFQYIVTLNEVTEMNDEILNKKVLLIKASERLLGRKF